MNDQQLIKSLKRSLTSAGRKIQYLSEEIEVLKAEKKSPMYDIDYPQIHTYPTDTEKYNHDYKVLETQFKEYMENNKSFWFWLSQRFNKQWLNR